MNIRNFFVTMMLLLILVFIFFKMDFHPKWFKQSTDEVGVAKLVTNLHSIVDSVWKSAENKSQQRVIYKATIAPASIICDLRHS